MRIRSIRLHPFAGQTDVAVEFQPGLNVLSGPNEAGKSTLLNALRVALLTPTKLGKRDWEREMERFMPLGGGDTIRLSLEFSEGGDFELVKSWGGNSSACLKMPGGEAIEDPATIESRLASLLGLKPGTWRKVLFAGQADLTGTLEDLNPEGEEFSDLAAWLRRSAFATDGISIEKLGDSLERRIESYEDHWDVVLSRPEKNRGIDHPWEMKVGKILKAWYAREAILRDRGLVETYEHKLDAVTARINECIKERDALAAFVEGHASAIEDADARGRLETEKRVLVAEGKDLRKVSLEWPKVEERRANLLGGQVKDRERIAGLEVKLKEAQGYEKNRSRRERWQRAEAKLEALELAKGELAGAREISDERMAELKALDEEAKHLEAGLAAGKLKLSFSAKEEMELEVQKDFGGHSGQTVGKGGTLDLEAGGRIVLRHEDWEMSVQSGDCDFSELQEKHQAARSKFGELLKAIGEDDLQAVQARHRATEEQKRKVEGLSQQLGEILEGETVEELRDAAGGDGGGPAPRPAAEVAAEKAKLEAGVEMAAKQLAEIDRDLARWIEDYESQEKLLDLLVDERGDLKALDEGIGKLKPLPEGVEDVDGFIADYRSREKRLKQIMEHDLPNLKVERAQLEGDSPDQSLKDLEEALLDAEAAFDHVQTEWRALLRIREVYQKLREEMDRGTLDPWMENLAKLSKPLSGGRYDGLRLGAASVGRAGGGGDIPYTVLSTGTRACLGLAVRLSMAQHFLEDRDGFVVLDDPMVDLDPERQRAASLILQEFAQDKQLIVLTCHPRHAEMIGGHVIEV